MIHWSAASDCCAEREYDRAIDKAFPTPFQGKTDAQGKVTLELPAGNEAFGG